MAKIHPRSFFRARKAFGLALALAAGFVCAHAGEAIVAPATAIFEKGKGADANSYYSSFSFCAPPTPPACAKTIKETGRAIASCEKQVETYVSVVFQYRACLARETERAVRESNGVIQSLRCARNAPQCLSIQPAAEEEAPQSWPVEKSSAPKKPVLQKRRKGQ